MAEERKDDATRGDGETPRKTEEQDSPEPERLTTPQEEAGQAIHQLEDPPQAEGQADR